MIFGVKIDYSQEWDQYSSIFDFWINISTYPRQNTSQNSRDVLFLRKKALARKPPQRRRILGEKSIFLKVDFPINDPSQIEATCLLSPLASPISPNRFICRGSGGFDKGLVAVTHQRGAKWLRWVAVYMHQSCMVSSPLSAIMACFEIHYSK